MTFTRTSFKKFIKELKSDNRGSSLVMVIVVVLFLTILATTLLYLSTLNVLMKRTDRDVKQSFYDTETAVEEIKAGITEMAASAAETAYINNMIRYSVDDPYTRYTNFQNEYFDALQKLWDKEATLNYGGDHVAMIRGMAEPKFSVDDTIITLSSYTAADGTVIPAGKLDTTDMATHGFVYLRNVSVTYTSRSSVTNQAYTSQIVTDFIFTVPEMNWSVDESYSSIVAEAHDTVDVRREYDIGDYVNYINWEKR